MQSLQYLESGKKKKDLQTAKGLEKEPKKVEKVAARVREKDLQRTSERLHLQTEIAGHQAKKIGSYRERKEGEEFVGGGEKGGISWADAKKGLGRRCIESGEGQ